MSRERWAPALAYVALAVAVTWPLVLDPGGVVVGAPRSDVWNSLWGMWFVDGAGAFPAHTALLDHPMGGRIAVADPLNAVIAWPLVHIWGPVVGYAALVLGHLVFAGLSAHALGRACGGNGWVAGVGYVLAPIALANLHNGSSEAIATGWLPLACLAVIRAVERGGWRDSLAAGIALALCALGGWYAGVGAWIWVGSVLVLGWAGVDLRTRLLRLAPGAVLALAITLPVAGGVRAVALADDGLVDIKQESDLARIRRTLGSADPRVFVVPGDFRSPDFSALEGNPSDFVHSAYLGWTLMGLSVWGAWRRRGQGRSGAWWVAGGVGVVLAMGPVLVWDGRPLSFGARGVGLPLPYLALEGLPGFGSLSLLYRLSGVSALAVAVLADRAPWWWVMPIAAEVLLVSPVSGLPAVTPVPEYPALAAMDADGAVLNLPPTAGRDYLYEQVLHERPMVGSLNSGINVAGLKVGRAARQVRAGDQPPRVLSEIARGEGIRWVVMHKDMLMDDTWITAAAAIREHGELVAEDDRVRVLRLY